MQSQVCQRNRGESVDSNRRKVAALLFIITTITEEEVPVAEVRIEDGIIRVVELDVQDPKAAAVLAEYPQVRWAEITRRALKIGLGYLKGGAQD